MLNKFHGDKHERTTRGLALLGQDVVSFGFGSGLDVDTGMIPGSYRDDTGKSAKELYRRAVGKTIVLR